MKYLLGIILVVLLLLLFFIPDKHISIKTNHVVRGSEIENFETEDVRSPYISPIDEMCKFGDTITCSKDKSIIESAERREEIGSYAEKECGVDLDNIRPECDVHVTGDAIFQRVVFANFDDDKYKVVDPTEFTNEHSFPLLQMSNDGEFEMVKHKAEFEKMENEMDKLPFLQDNRCKFVIDNVSDHNNYPFFTDNKLLNHPDGPKEPNLCYIPPSVVNVLFAKQDKAADPNYKLCSSDNELIYHSRYNDIVEIVGMDVSKHIDKDIGTPMCVLKFKDKDDDVSDSEYSEKISEYLNFLHGKDPELQIRQGGYSWIRDKFNLDKKIIDKQNEDEIKMASIVVDSINNSDGLANQLLGYNADPNKYINDYVMHAIDEKYNPEHDIDRNGDPIRELNMSYNCAYHGTDGKDLNDKPYSKKYIDFKGVGSHISHLETQDLNTYLDRWSEYGDPINKKNQMNTYVNDNAVFTNVWDRNEGKDDIVSKENKCEKTLLKREGENGNYPDPWLGFHRIDETLFDGNKSSFLYRNDTSGLENSAERYYRQGCEWHHLQHIDKYSESNRRSESCDWVASRNIDFNCKEFGKMFVNEKENPVDKYYTSLSREKGYEDADDSIVDFLLNTSDSNMRKFSKDGNRCVYRDENNDGCVTESDLPLLPSPNVKNRVPIFGSGAIINDDTNFVWGSNLEVKGDSVNGYVISGNPMPHIEPKLSNVLNIQEDPSTKESNITLGDEYMVIASNGTVAYVLRDTSDHDSFDRDPNIKIKITKADPEYNGNTSVLNPPGTPYDYTLGSGKCVISNDKMIVDKNSWIDGSFNAGKIQVGDFVKRSRDVLKNDPSNPMDSTVVCDIDKDKLEDGGTYEAEVVENEVKLTPYTCEVTKPSNSTIHLKNDVSGKDFTSYIKADNYDNTRAYKFINKTTHGDFDGIGSSLLYIDKNRNQKDIQVNDSISTILPGKVYEYSGDGKFKYDKFAICDSPGVSINNGICEAKVQECADNPGPKSVGLYHYTNYPQYNRVDQGVYVYKNNNKLQRVPSGLSNLDITKLTFSEVKCTDLGAALSKLTSGNYDNSCDIRRISKPGNNDTITSAADPVDKNEAGECVIGSDYVVIGKSSWDNYSNTLIQPKDTNGGNEALSNIFKFQKYGILPNTNILQDAGREELANGISLSDAEKACDDDKTCKGIQHVINVNKYFKFKNLESKFLKPNNNSTIYVKRAECGSECLEYCSDPGSDYANRTSNVFLEIQDKNLENGSNLGTSDLEFAKSKCSMDANCVGVQLINNSYHSGTYTTESSGIKKPPVYYKHKACGSTVKRVEEILPLVTVKLPDELLGVPIVVHWITGNIRIYMESSEIYIDKFAISRDLYPNGIQLGESYIIEDTKEIVIFDNVIFNIYNIKVFHSHNSILTLDDNNNLIVSKTLKPYNFIFRQNSDNSYQICVIQNGKILYFNHTEFNFTTTILNSIMIEPRTDNYFKDTTNIENGEYYMKVYNTDKKVLINITTTNTTCIQNDKNFKVYIIDIGKNNKINCIIQKCNSNVPFFYRIFEIDDDDVVIGFINFEENGLKTVDMLLRRITCTFADVPKTHLRKNTELTSQFSFENPTTIYDLSFANKNAELLNNSISNRSLQFQNFNGFDFSEIQISVLDKPRVTIQGISCQQCKVTSYGKYLMSSNGTNDTRIVMTDITCNYKYDNHAFIFYPIEESPANKKFLIFLANKLDSILCLNKNDGYVYLRSYISGNLAEGSVFEINVINDDTVEKLNEALLINKEVKISTLNNIRISLYNLSKASGYPNTNFFIQTYQDSSKPNDCNNNSTSKILSEFRLNGKKFKQYSMYIYNKEYEKGIQKTVRKPLFIKSANLDITHEEKDNSVVDDYTSIELSDTTSKLVEDPRYKISFIKDTVKSNVYYILTPNGYFYHHEGILRFNRTYKFDISSIMRNDANKFVIDVYKPYLNETDTYVIYRKGTRSYLRHRIFWPRLPESEGNKPYFQAGEVQTEIYRADVKLHKVATNNINDNIWKIEFVTSTYNRRFLGYTDNYVSIGMPLNMESEKETRLRLIEEGDTTGHYKITYENGLNQTFIFGIDSEYEYMSWRETQPIGKDVFYFEKK